MNENRITHGGARPGSGRKAAGEPTRSLTLRIPVADLKALEAAGVKNLSRFYAEAGKKAIERMK